MYQVKVLNKIPERGLQLFPKDLYSIGDDFSDPDIIILRSKNILDFEIGPNLKAVGRSGAGTNNIPVERLTENGVVVFNTPGANANAVKELVVAGLLMSTRNLLPAIKKVSNIPDNIDDFHDHVESIKGEFKGIELSGKSIGIIGLGSIGVSVANTCTELGMNVFGFDPLMTVENAWKLSRNVNRIDQIDDLVGLSDFITIHVPLVEKTKGFLGKDLLSKFPKGSTLLNFSRSEIVDIQAVKNSLEKGILNYYVSDFPEKDIIYHPRVIFFPHLGASTIESEENCATMVSEQLRSFIEHGIISNSVNLPNTNLFKTKFSRIAIINKNIPNMVSQITSVIGNMGFNIVEFINKSRDSVAYNIIDFDASGQNQSDMINEIKNIEGILKVWSIPSNNLL
ncbi:MAG: 3-phosphoglycerate dehydrogenase [Chloroflexi bacterium]|nr:3-phosphoglycerate dehydrogenase [Chloroflexota bacterium]|tara:strand:- start:1212 stop:2399 length:1188 start_codon:yes stop_codon:yes gene_type:complete